MGLIFGEDKRVGDWVVQRIPRGTRWNGEYVAFGLERHGELVAGVVYTDCSGANITANIAVAGRLSKDFFRVAFGYPFNQLKRRRLTVYVDDSNHRSLNFVENLGFTRESVMERAHPNGDVIVYRMFKEDCKWV